MIGEVPGAGRALLPGDLLFGEDHDFVVNAYIALLGRWPDAQGYRHFLDQVRDRPEQRVAVLRSLAGSEEAQLRTRRAPGGAAVPVPADGPILPSDPRRALAAQLDLRTAFLRAEIEQLREAVALLAAPGGTDFPDLGAEIIEARDAALRSELEALRREVRERLEGPHDPAGTAATAEERAAQAVSRLVTDYLGDMLAVAEARFEARLRGIEARLLALGGAPAREPAPRFPA